MYLQLGWHTPMCPFKGIHFLAPFRVQPSTSTQLCGDCISSWWFHPIWEIFVKMDHFPRLGVKNVKNISDLPPPIDNPAIVSHPFGTRGHDVWIMLWTRVEVMVVSLGPFWVLTEDSLGSNLPTFWGNAQFGCSSCCYKFIHPLMVMHIFQCILGNMMQFYFPPMTDKGVFLVLLVYGAYFHPWNMIQNGHGPKNASCRNHLATIGFFC